MDLCGRVESLGVVRVRPVGFIRLKQIKIWPCGGRALHMNDGASQGMLGRKWISLRALSTGGRGILLLSLVRTDSL